MTHRFEPPRAERERSTIARRIGGLADDAGLFFGHFEHTVHLPPPDAWAPRGRPDLGAVAPWRQGALEETKFLHFRLDRMVSSFHPAHEPRWTPHELLHRLVGFAWRPDATVLWHASAARLAELLPVVVWYTLDAVDDPRGAETRAEEARAWVARERDAIRRGLRDGAPIRTPRDRIDLCTDGLAWAASHAGRVRSEEFAMFVELFFRPGEAWHPSIESLDARVEALADALLDSGALSPSGDGAQWRAQDVAWRLLHVRADCDADTAASLDDIVRSLAADLDLARAVSAYEALCEEVELPSPADTFAVGWDVSARYGRSARQIGEGLETACPSALALLGTDRADAITAFTAADTMVRSPVGRRFAAWLAAQSTHGGAALDAAVDAARLEVAVTYAAPPDLGVLTLKHDPPVDTAHRLAPGVELVALRHDAARLLRGAIKPSGGMVAVLRRPDGEVDVLRLGPAAAALSARMRDEGCVDTSGLPEHEAAALRGAGVWAPRAWRAAVT